MTELSNGQQPSVVFVQSQRFKKAIKALRKKYPSIVSDLDELLIRLEERPDFGIPLGKDCYKIRMAISSRHAGKSGGARVITCARVVKETIYLLTIFDKSSQETINDSELEQLLKEIGE
jgi:hypothetical protein